MTRGWKSNASPLDRSSKLLTDSRSGSQDSKNWVSLLHPGIMLQNQILEVLGLSVTEAACALDIDCNALTDVLAGHSPISVDLAMRLSVALRKSPEVWLTYQMQYDLCQWQKQAEALKLKPLKHLERSFAEAPLNPKPRRIKPIGSWK